MKRQWYATPYALWMLLFTIVPLLFVAAAYLFMVIVLTFFQRRLERNLQASDRK